MKRDIDFFLGKVSKIIKGENFLYCVCKKGCSFGFINAAMRLQLQKPDSLIFVRHGNRFTFRNEFEGLPFKGLLIYGSLAKLIKKELVIYTFPELKKEIYNKHDAFALGLDSVDNKLNISLLKNNIELDLKIFLETGEEKQKKQKMDTLLTQLLFKEL